MASTDPAESRQIRTVGRNSPRDSQLHPDRIAYPNCTAVNDPGCQPTVTAHGIVAARPQVLFHARTGVTLACYLQYDLMAKSKVMVFQRQQVQSGHDQITAQFGRIDTVAPYVGSNGRQMFGLNERNVPIATMAAVMITNEPFFVGYRYLIDHRNDTAPFGPNPDPLDTARPRKYLK